METKIPYLLAICTAALTIVDSVCPPANVTFPCDCEESSVGKTIRTDVWCVGVHKYDVAQVFRNMSTWLKPNQRSLFGFVYKNEQIEEWPSNMFAGIKFRQIQLLGDNNLTKIHRDAFAGTNEAVESFIQSGRTKLGADKRYVKDLFDTLSSLVNVKTIVMELDELEEIPERAFHRRTNKRLAKLEHLRLFRLQENRTGKVRSIGDYAFSDLDYVKDIFLDRLNISSISARAFKFDNLRPAKNPLKIHLKYNQLNENSFEAGSLNFKTPTELFLANNKIKYLNETIFKPYLERHKLYLKGNLLEISCRMKWLIKNKKKFKYNLFDAACDDGSRDGKDLWDLTEIDFPNCK